MINISPTLFIGFGGSGSKALREIKDSLRDILKRSFPDTPGALSGDIPPCFQFLEVDIDQTDALKSGFKGYAQDFLNCDPEASFEQLDARIKKADGNYEYIKKWWPEGLGKTISQKNRDQAMKEGYRLRQLGKLALWLKARDFWDRVAACENACTSTDTSIRVSSMYGGGLIVEGDLQIYVVASIAGGTGCGMLIDGLFMLHNILNGRYYVRTYLLLPSVYSKVISSDNTEPLVNAYAALKEYDHFNHGKDTFTAELSKRHSITSPEYISDQTYILGGRTEGNKTFDGKGIIVSQKTARLIVNSVFGFCNVEAQRIQDDIRELTGKEVSAFYQSLGVHELRYPNAEIKQFIRTYMKQLLAAYLRKSDDLAEYTAKYAPKGDIAGCAEDYISRGILSRIMTIQKNQVSFSSAPAEAFLCKKKLAAAKIREQFTAARRDVDRLYPPDSKWENAKKGILTEVENWLYNCIGDIFADFDNGGVDAVNLFLAKVETIATYPEVLPLTQLSDKDYGRLEVAFVKDFPGFFSFDDTKLAHIDQFLQRLKQDINARIDFHAKNREKEIADAILEIVNDCRREWIQVVRKLEEICSSCYVETQAAAETMQEHVAQLEWVGCSLDEIAILKEGIRHYAVKDCLVLVGELRPIIQTHSDIKKPKGPKERLKEIEDKLKMIEERIDAHAQSIFTSNIHDESITIVDRVDNYVRQYRRNQGNSQENAVQDFLGRDVLSLSQPLNMITDSHAGSILNKYIIVSIPQDDIVRLQRELPPEIRIVSLRYMDPYSMLFVQTRRELPTNEIKDIEDYYEAYCNCNKNPAPNKYSGIKLSSHLFDDSTWKEIVQVAVTTDDVKNYIKLGQKLEVIVRYAKSAASKAKTPYWIFVDPMMSVSDNPDDQRIFGGPFVGEVKIMEALLKDSTLMDKLKNMLIETLCSTFERGRMGHTKYLDFKSELMNPKGKKNPRIDIPDEIESVVKKNMGWDL